MRTVNIFLNNPFAKLAILLILSGILILSVKKIKTFILIFIALKSFFAIFFNINIVAGLNPLEIAGFLFPVVLFIYWTVSGLKMAPNKYKTIYVMLLAWVLFSTVLNILSSRNITLGTFSNFMKFSNGLAVFIIFPILFQNRKDIESLNNAFFIATFFPLAQGLGQLLFGQSFAGMRTSAIVEQTTEYTMYYGYYYKYDGYSWAAIVGGCLMIYKLSQASNKKQKLIYFGMLLLYILIGSLSLSRTFVFHMITILAGLMIALKRKLKFFLVLSIISAIILGSFFQRQYRQYEVRSEAEFKILSGERPIESGFHGRIGVWKLKFAEFNQKPLNERFVNPRIAIGPHGDYLQWLFEYGYIGFVLYVLLISCLFIGTIKLFFKIKNVFKKLKLSFSKSYIDYYGIMVITALIIWIIGAFIYNPSWYPDYAYFIIGNTAIFLSKRSKNLKREIMSFINSSFSQTKKLISVDNSLKNEENDHSFGYKLHLSHPLKK